MKRDVLSIRQYAFLTSAAVAGNMYKFKDLDQRTLASAIRREWVDANGKFTAQGVNDFNLWQEVQVPMRMKPGELSPTVLKLLSERKRAAIRRRR